jgi:hypothetical protein
MTTTRTAEQGWTMSLRRQKARTVNGKPDGGYTDTFEIICRACGDDPRWDYHDVTPRLQRIRGPYPMDTGVTQYVAHLEWHEALDRSR